MKALSRWTYGMVALSFLATSCTSIDEMLDSYPPRFPIYKMFKADEGRNRLYPPGQEMQYVSKKYSDGYVIDSTPSSSAEARERERLNGDLYNTIRKAAEVHRRVRKYAVAELIRPGVRLIDMCEALENATRTYLEADKSPLAGLKAGIGFATGCSLNNCAAHYTPNPGDDTVLKYDDVMKLDFGTHVNGYIVDSAFTWAPNPKYEQLMAAVKDATYTGIKEAGIDARLKDVGEAIQEVMESYEVVLDGKTHQVKCVENLMGHSIQPYIIHGGKSVPITRGGPSTRMEEGEVYAIETFGTTGRGMVREVGDCSHFSLIPPSQRHGSGHVKMVRAKQLMQHIDKHFSTLPWCRRYLERSGESRYVLALRSLVDAGVVEEYPPLCDVKGSYVAQYEHTIILRPTCKEIVSKGDDW